MSSPSQPLRQVARLYQLGDGVRVGLAPALLLALGLFLATGPLAWALFLLLGIAGGIALLRNPDLGIYALAVAVPFGSLYALELAGITISAAQFLLVAVLVTWSLRSLAHRDMRLVHSPLSLPLLFFLSAMGLSLLRAQALVPAAKEIIKWIGFGILLFFVSTHLNEQERRWAIAALLIAGIGQGLLGIYQFLRQVGPSGFVLFGRYMRAYGTFAQPNPYGGYLGLLLPLAYSIVLTRWQHFMRTERVEHLAEHLIWLLACAATVLMTIALIMSWSRGALLGLILGAVLVGLALVRRAWPLFLVAGLVLLVTLPIWQPLLPADYLGRLDDTTTYLGQNLRLVEIDDNNFAIVERLAHWQAAWLMFEQSPWLGVGIGQYATVYPSVALPRWQDPLGHAHNTYLNMLAETGMVGLAAYLSLMISALALAWRRARATQGWSHTVALGTLGMMGHLLAHGIVDNLYVQELYLLIAIILGMLQIPLTRRTRIQACEHNETPIHTSSAGEISG